MPGETPAASLMDEPPVAADPAADPAAEPAKGGGDAVDPAVDADPAADPADGSADDGADGDGDGPKEGEDEEGKDEGAPDEYADFTAAEGVELDADAMEAFKPLAKELNLTQEQAQKLVDVQTATAQRWQEAVQQHVVNTRLGWREAAQSDAEIGGDKFAENLAVAKAGRDAFGNDALKTLLDESGLGDHPEVIRFFYNVGKANSEHDFVSSGKPEKAKSFYDHPTSKK